MKLLVKLSGFSACNTLTNINTQRIYTSTSNNDLSLHLQYSCRVLKVKIYNNINKNTRIHSIMGFDFQYYIGNNVFLKYFHFSALHGGQGKKHLFSNYFCYYILYFTVLLNKNVWKIITNVSQSCPQKFPTFLATTLTNFLGIDCL